MDKQSWQPVLQRATEDINLSLSLRLACRDALNELGAIRKGLEDLKVKTRDISAEVDQIREGRLE